MKRFYSFLTALLLTTSMLVACNATQEPVKESETKPKTEQKVEETAAFPVAVTDALGDNATIEAKPERIVTLVPSITETVFALGLGEAVVGVSDFDNYPEEAAAKEKVGGMEFNVEQIIALKPDIVLAHESGLSKKEGVEQLRNAGVTVIVVQDAQSFDKMYDSFALIGEATGTSEKAAELIKNMKEQFAAIEEKAAKIPEADRKTVFIEVSPAPDIFTTGKGTFMDEMLTIIHAKNAAKDEEGWVQLNEEAIITLNPDTIITTYGDYVDHAPAQILERNGWQDIQAIKAQQVYEVHPDLVTRSGPRLVEGVEELAKAVYPEIFAK